jgi:hypothetical protein
MYDKLVMEVRSSYVSACVLYIDRVDTPKLHARYADYVFAMVAAGHKPTEAHGWHGSTEACIYNIANEGFDPDQNVRSAYGKGTYIARDAVYSKEFAIKSQQDDLSFMLYCKFAYKSLAPGLAHRSTEPWVALTNPVNTIFVVPDKDAVVPLYIVAFHKGPSIR